MGDIRIENLYPAQPPIKSTGKVEQSVSTGFDEVIKQKIDKVNGLDKEANRSIVDLLQGKTDIHETMIAVQKADISMRLLLAIRNKVIEAYREIMHMQF